MTEKNYGGLKRPGGENRKQSFSGKCDIRLTAEENNKLDTLAERNGVSRSDVMRRALADFWKFNSSEED